jgi:uncharacterized protein YcsI (UPF0317 family)
MAEASNCVTFARGCNVPMYHTSIAAHAGGPFHGPMVLRPLRRGIRPGIKIAAGRDTSMLRASFVIQTK